MRVLAHGPHCRLERLDWKRTRRWLASWPEPPARRSRQRRGRKRGSSGTREHRERADAEQSGENDRKEGTTERYAAGQVFFVLSGGARGEVECVGRAGSGNDVGRHEGA